jgi:predicted SAM-dependent methyltransferase
MTRKLDIGAARNRPVARDFETADCCQPCDHLVKWGESPLPFDDGSFGEVYTSHTLEHVPWFQTPAALAELHRILAPGGLLEVWVPNFAYLVECYLRGACGDQWYKFNPDRDPMVWLNGRLFTYGPGDENWHRAVFSPESLAGHLGAAGFVDIERIPVRTRGTSHGPIDLGMRASR